MRPFRAFSLAIALGVGVAPAAGAVSLRFVPESARVVEGDTFHVDLVADLDEPILAFGLDLDFDTEVLGLSAPPGIGPAWLPVDAPDGDGLAGAAFPDGLTGDGVLLARLHFTALAPGSSQLTPSFSAGDLTEGFFLDPTGMAPVDSLAARIDVAPLPEPGTALLLGLGLAALSRRVCG